MEILYRQAMKTANSGANTLDFLGVERLMLKFISFERDRVNITRKSHYHMNYEVHIITKGQQTYGFSGENLTVKPGMMLIIPPGIKHIALGEEKGTEKYAFTFSLSDPRAILKSPQNRAIDAPTPNGLIENIEIISREEREKNPYYRLVSDSRAAECILACLRRIGVTAPTTVAPTDPDENPRVALAIQYIEDNATENVSVPELASYCCISEKQLERLFFSHLGTSVKDYVRRRRCHRIEKLLADPRLTLRDISELMHFSSEYYFNAFFKKYAGMTPGAFRKSVIKG